jgi:hypothetical protein
MNDDNQYYAEHPGRPPASSLERPMGGFSPSSPNYQPLGAASPLQGGQSGYGQGGFSAPTQPDYPPNDPPPPPPPPGYGPPPAPGYPAPSLAPARQRDNTPVIVEVVGAIFGFYGIGWLMVGETKTGVLLLIAGLIWAAIVWIGVTLTAGVAACCFVPIHAVFIALSAVSLSNHIKRMP